MKGLIYKNLLLSRKYYIMAFIYCLMFALIAILVRISMICGNLSHDEEVLDSLTRNMYILQYTPCLPFLFAFSADGGAIFSDFNCHWIRFCFTTPINEKKITVTKMISTSASVTFAYIISLIYTTIFCLIGGNFPAPDIIINITGIYFAVLGVALTNVALCFTLRKKQTVEIILTATVSIIGLVMTFFMMLKLDSMTTDENFDLLDFFRSEYGWILDYFMPTAFIFMLITGIICYYVSVKSLQRKEN